MSECYLLDHMPKWICELSNLEVFKGFVARSGGNKNQFCRLSDLSKLRKLRKLSIRIAKHLDPEDACGLESLNWLSILTVIWGINLHDNTDNGGKVRTISFPKSLEKLDIRCYPDDEAEELLNPEVLPKLKRLYIRGGKLTKLANVSGWEIKVLRLRFLKHFEIEWSDLSLNFTKLEYLDYEECLCLKNFPENTSVWDTKKHGPFTDEPIQELDIAGRVELKIINPDSVPLVENKQMMMVELTGGNSIRDRPSLCLVAVIDVSESMRADNKLEKMKTALLFFISKLTSVDLLSIVVFSTDARMVCPLRWMNRNCKKELEILVNGLKAEDTKAYGTTNILDGLWMGLDILKDHRNGSRRTLGVVVMSNGMQSGLITEGRYFDTGAVAVHTFGFGKDHDTKVLWEIARRSRGGTFSDVSNTNNLTKAFAVCLAGLLTVVVQDLTLTITPIKEDSIVKCIYEEKYSSAVDAAGPKTISFGNLYSGEVRKVYAELHLPATDKQGSADVIRVSYSYRLSGKQFESNPVIITVHCMKTVSDQIPPEVIAELFRIYACDKLTSAIDRMDNLLEPSTVQLGRVRAKVNKALEILKGVEMKRFKSNSTLASLMAELVQLLKMMKRHKNYKLGCPFAYSVIISHRKQRAAVRGGYMKKSILSFGTPFMLNFLNQENLV